MSVWQSDNVELDLSEHVFSYISFGGGEKMEMDLRDEGWQSFYRILSGAVVPRPIAWVSTVSGKGVVNLAPYSFFNLVCAQPPHLLWCPGRLGRDGRIKDSYENARQTGQFVVNFVTESLAEQMNLTSAEVESDIDEFELAGLTAAPCRIVSAPRVSESPINLECEVTQIVDVSTQPGGGSVVIGRVVYAHVHDDVLADGILRTEVYRPIGRAGGRDYVRLTDTFSMNRPLVVK